MDDIFIYATFAITRRRGICFRQVGECIELYTLTNTFIGRVKRVDKYAVANGVLTSDGLMPIDEWMKNRNGVKTTQGELFTT